jgi:glycosyltransferase involved in cell wall biosynthesis
MDAPRIAVVMPSYRSRNLILGVLNNIPSEVTYIIVVDDCCPEGTGQHVKDNFRDQRVTVLQHNQNMGVGAATKTGFLHALSCGADIIIKIDSDGQMDPKLIYRFVKPILEAECDYAKGNRFYSLEYLWGMPRIRKLGNAMLSFITKLSTGYWDIMDPTNGFIAIHSKVLSLIPLEKLENRFLFETDMLFRLNIIRAVVRDIPMEAKYGQEISNLNIPNVLPKFLVGNVKRFLKRLFYNYLLRDFNLASINGLAGVILLIFGFFFGAYEWHNYASANIPAPTGIIFISVLPIIIGTQLSLSAINYDMSQTPKKVLHLAL